MMLETLYILGVIQLFLVSVALVILLPIVRKKSVYPYLSLSSITLSFVSSLSILYLIIAQGRVGTVYIREWGYLGFSLSFIADSLTAVMMTLVSFLSLIIGIYSAYYMRREYGFERYFVFYTFFVASMMLVVSANNLLLLFIGWEGTGLCSYALIGHWYRDEEEHYVGDLGRKRLGTPMYSSPSMSGLRAILFTRIPDILMLFSLFILMHYSSTLDIDKIMAESSTILSILYNKGLLKIVMLMMFIGPMAKSAQFPLHEWLVTAMTGPTPVSALIHAATMVKAGVYYMLRITPFFAIGGKHLLLTSPIGNSIWGGIEQVYLFLGIMGAFTAFSLATMAIAAREAKLILAYSTASQLGYMFMGIGASVFTGNPGFVLTVVTAHLIAHAIFKAGLFLGAGIMIHEGKGRFIDRWPNLYSGLKLTLSYMWILVLSLAGLPPLIGFWTKDKLIEMTYSAGLYTAWSLGLFTVLLTAFYSTRLLLYNYKYHSGEEKVREPPLYVSSTYGILAALSIAIGVIWPLLSKSFFDFITSSYYTTALIEPHGATWVLPTLSLSLLGIGLLLSYTGYVWGVVDTVKISQRLYPVTNFLYDRWLINTLYYWFSMGIILPISRIVYLYIEKPLDLFYHLLLTSKARDIGTYILRIQSGDLRRYLIYFTIGILVVILLILGGLS